MLKKILGEEIAKCISLIKYQSINEIRIRTDKPIVIQLCGKPYFLSSKGVTGLESEAIIATKQLVEDIIFRASENSIYAVNEELKQGFLVLNNGIRIGIAGSFITENKEVKTITNFSSLNIRIPHEVKNCSLSAFPFIYSNGELSNCLILGAPGSGKTTFIRDFMCQLSDRNLCYNILLIDERGEIVGNNKILNVGKFTDVISFSEKSVGIIQGLRSLAPNLVVTDEIGNEEDADALCEATKCGVKVMATIHAKNLKELSEKSIFYKIKNCFDKYVVLSMQNGIGTIEGVYNSEFSRLSDWRIS